MDRKPSALSGGQRQRVAMGRALVRDPAIFLFDEPLSNLDAKLRVDMRTEIKKLHKTLGATIVYVTHDQIEAMTLATKIAVMNGGVVQQLGTPHEIYYKPANLFVASFMGSPSMNILAVDVAEGVDRKPELVLETGEGGPVRISLPEMNIAPGHYLMGLRPEHVSNVDSVAKESEEYARFTSKVEVVEPAGADTYVVVPLGSENIVARVNGEVEVEAGDSLELAINLKRIYFFDEESGKRISTEAFE
jgi:multiple sugar transport system ATP-binding protein